MTRSGALLPLAQWVARDAAPQPSKLLPSAHRSIDPPEYQRNCQLLGLGTVGIKPAMYHCCVSLKPSISEHVNPVGGIGVAVSVLVPGTGVRVGVDVLVAVDVSVAAGVGVGIDNWKTTSTQ